MSLEELKTSGLELNPRGAEVEGVNPYDDNGGEAGGTYPARDDATNYARCAYQDQPISCSLKEKFDEYDRRRNSVITRIVHSGQRNAPTLKQGGRLSKAELEIRRAIAATGKFDNEASEARGSLDNSIPGLDASQSGLQTQQPKPDYKKLREAVSACAKSLFGVDVIGEPKWSDKGRNGQVNFSVTQGYVWSRSALGQVAGSGTAIKTFSVYNDSTSYNIDQLGAGGKGYQYTGTETTGIYRVSGIKGLIQWTNETYTASDADGYLSSVQETIGNGLGFSTFIHVQIHETGNALSRITGNDRRDGIVKWTDPSSGKEHDLRKPDYDNGQAFEQCAFLVYRYFTGVDK